MWVRALLTVFTLIPVLIGLSSSNAISLQHSGRAAGLNVNVEEDGGPIVEVGQARRGNISTQLGTKEVEPRVKNLDHELGKTLSSDAKSAEVTNITERWTHYPIDGEPLPTTIEQVANNIIMIDDELQPISDERQSYNDQEVMTEEDIKLTTKEEKATYIMVDEELETTTVTSTMKPKSSGQLVLIDAEVPFIKKILSDIRTKCDTFQELDTSFTKRLNLLLEQMPLSFQKKQTMKHFRSLPALDSKLGPKQRNTLESSSKINIMKYRVLKNMYVVHTKTLYDMYKSIIGSTGLNANHHVHLKGDNGNANDTILDSLMNIAIKLQAVLMELDKTMHILVERTFPFYKTQDSASQLDTETFSKEQNEVTPDTDYLEKYIKKGYGKYNINTTEVLRELFQQQELNKMLIHIVNLVIASIDNLLPPESVSDDAPQILRKQEKNKEEIDSKENSVPRKDAGNMAIRFVEYLVGTFKTLFNWLLGWNRTEDVKGTLRIPSITPSENVTEKR